MRRNQADRSSNEVPTTHGLDDYQTTDLRYGIDLQRHAALAGVTKATQHRGISQHQGIPIYLRYLFLLLPMEIYLRDLIAAPSGHILAKLEFIA